MKTLTVRLTLMEEMLGTKSANPALCEEFIASKRPEETDPDETATLPPVAEELQKGTTVFNRDADGCPFLFDYQVKGFFKDAAGSLERVTKALKAYRKVIDGLVFVGPRRVRLVMPEGGVIGICERPLRAQTAQGERVALARSETVPAGTTIAVEVTLLDDTLEKYVRQWLDYGKFRGIGQWRNSGKGRFTWSE